MKAVYFRPHLVHPGRILIGTLQESGFCAVDRLVVPNTSRLNPGQLELLGFGYSTLAARRDNDRLSLPICLGPHFEMDSVVEVLEQHEKDLADAAGELMVDLPQPGSPLAKVLRANSLMRQELARKQKHPSPDHLDPAAWEWSEEHDRWQGPGDHHVAIDRGPQRQRDGHLGPSTTLLISDWEDVAEAPLEVVAKAVDAALLTELTHTRELLELERLRQEEGDLATEALRARVATYQRNYLALRGAVHARLSGLIKTATKNERKHWGISARAKARRLAADARTEALENALRALEQSGLAVEVDPRPVEKLTQPCEAVPKDKLHTAQAH